MPTGFVYEEREELGCEHERRRSLLCEGRVERCFRIVAVIPRELLQIEMLDVFPAGLPREPRVVTAHRLSSGFHGEYGETGARLDDLLRDVGAFARHEMLARPIRRDGRSPGLDIRADRRRIDRAQVIDAFGERDSERVAAQDRSVLAALRRDRREHQLSALHRSGCLRAAKGFVHELTERRGVGAIGGRESPRALVDDAKCDTPIGRPRYGLDCSVFDADRLVLALYGPGVRVCRAARGRNGDKVGDEGIRCGHTGKPRRGARSMKTSVAATAQSRLSSAALFDLLADPRGCVTWHDHPLKDRPQSTDAPAGLALAGAEYWSRGLCGTIAWRARTSVTAAERSRQYATETEIIYEHPRVPRARSSERFILEPKGVGCFVRY